MWEDVCIDASYLVGCGEKLKEEWLEDISLGSRCYGYDRYYYERLFEFYEDCIIPTKRYREAFETYSTSCGVEKKYYKEETMCIGKDRYLVNRLYVVINGEEIYTDEYDIIRLLQSNANECSYTVEWRVEGTICIGESLFEKMVKYLISPNGDEEKTDEFKEGRMLYLKSVECGADEDIVKIIKEVINEYCDGSTKKIDYALYNIYKDGHREKIEENTEIIENSEECANGFIYKTEGYICIDNSKYEQKCKYLLYEDGTEVKTSEYQVGNLLEENTDECDRVLNMSLSAPVEMWIHDQEAHNYHPLYSFRLENNITFNSRTDLVYTLENGVTTDKKDKININGNYYLDFGYPPYVNYRKYVLSINSIPEVQVNGSFSMFKDLPNCKRIDLSNGEVTIMAHRYSYGTHIFANNPVLEEIVGINNIRNGAPSNNYMFANCYALKEVIIDKSEVLDTASYQYSAQRNYAYMFLNCHSLKKVKLPKLISGLIKSIDNMFENCYSLETIILDGFICHYASCSDMFKNCNNLRYISMKESDETMIEKIKTELEKASLTSQVTIITE